jgi:hypothetical protein
VKHHQARFAEAIHALYCFTTWDGPGWLQLRLRGEDHDTVVQHRCTGPAKLADRVRFFNERFTDEITISLPRPKPQWGTAGPSSILWCRIEGSDQEARARRFKPFPSMVLREGASTRRLLIWALTERLDWTTCVDLNRRLAYHLRAVQKHGDPDTLEIPAPGTCLTVGRSRPVPIVVDRLVPEFYVANRVAGRLRKPPPADAWQKGRAA